MIFPESWRLEGYITNKLPNISRCIADIYTNWPWFILLNFAEVYIQRPLLPWQHSIYIYIVHKINLLIPCLKTLCL